MDYAKQMREALERTEAARHANPELAARLDKFVAENAQLREYYGALSHAELVRELMRVQMKHERVEVTERRNHELAQWVRENPDVAAKVEERIKNVIAQKEAHAQSLKAAEHLSQQESMRISRGIRP